MVEIRLDGLSESRIAVNISRRMSVSEGLERESRRSKGSVECKVVAEGRKVLPYRWYPNFRPVTTVVGDESPAEMITLLPLFASNCLGDHNRPLT